MPITDDHVTAVYDELRLMARRCLRRRTGTHSLGPTALVHETYLRLAAWKGFQYRSRAEFFGAAASVMRTVLAAAARRRHASRRDSNLMPLVTTVAINAEQDLFGEIVQLDRTLSRLAEFSPEAARVVEVRVFGGLSIEEAAEHLGVSPATVKRRWTAARAWLIRELYPNLR